MTAMICSQCGAGLTGSAVECDYCGTVYERKDARPGRGQKPDCPRCHQALRSKTISGVRIAHCKRCAGMWVPHDAMPALLSLRKNKSRKLHALNHSYKKHGAFSRDARPSSLQRDVAPARCPACHHSMRLESVTRDGAIYLDVCNDHGCWFDQSELRALMDRSARDMLRRTSGGRRQVVPRESRSGDWDDVSAYFLFHAIGNIVEEAFDFFD